MRNSRIQKILAPALFAMAVVFLAAGTLVRYEISPDEIEEIPSPPLMEPIPGQPPFIAPPFGQPKFPEPPPPEPVKIIPSTISDYELVLNATFTGIVKHDGTLFWTYDPTEKRGKRACPT